MTLHAVIFAGGRGERLGGVRKGDLRVGGIRLVDRIARALDRLHSPLMIATGPMGNDTAVPPGAIAVPDLERSVGGPLAGIVAAVASLQARGITEGLLVSAAVDTPFLPLDFVAVMQAGLADAQVAYAAWQDDFYPTNAIWRLEALQSMPKEAGTPLASGSLKTLQIKLQARIVDWTHSGQANPFLSLNTMGDLLALGRMERRH